MCYCLSSMRADHQHSGVKLLNPNGYHSVPVNKSTNLFMVRVSVQINVGETQQMIRGCKNKGNHTPIPFYSVLKCLQSTSKTEHYFVCYFIMCII